MIHGTLVGQVKSANKIKQPAAPTVVIARPPQKSKAGRLAGFLMALMLLFALSFVAFFYMLTPQKSEGPSQQDSGATAPDPDPAAASQQENAPKQERTQNKKNN